MKQICQQFQTSFEQDWLEKPDLEVLLSKDDHWKMCDDCGQFVQSYRLLISRLDASNDAAPQPDFGRMRTGVWSTIDRSKKQSSWVSRLIKPVILAPAAVVIIAIAVFVFLLQNGKQTIDLNNEYFATVDSVATADYPSEQELQDMFNSEFENSVDDYIIQNSSYTAIQQYFSTMDTDWNQVLQSLANQQI